MSDQTNGECPSGAAPLRSEIERPMHPCGVVLDRRRFLRDATVAVGAALVASGFTPSRALADGIHQITALPSMPSGGGRLVERTYALPTADGVWVDTDNRLALVRVNRQIFAFSLECPHKGRVLEWIDAEGRFYCSKHKARYAADGHRVSGRRTPDLDRFALRLQQGRVIIAMDRILAIDTDPMAWSAAVVRV